MWTLVKPPAELTPKCTEYRTGYLTVPLDYDASQPTSNVSLELRVSAKLACSTDDSNKPCPILFYHNGGPGSNDGACTRKDYNGRYDTIGIAQRGIGEDTIWLKGVTGDDTEDCGYLLEVNGTVLASDPVHTYSSHLFNGTFTSSGIINGECPGPSYVYDPARLVPVGRSPNNKIFDEMPQSTNSICKGQNANVQPPKGYYLDPVEDEQAIGQKFKFLQSRLQACTDDPHWEIALPGEESANFLDFVGTHLLAMDLDRLREAFGAEKMSCYGFSYGTAVCSTYAAQFPDNIGAPQNPPLHACPCMFSAATIPLPHHRFARLKWQRRISWID